MELHTARKTRTNGLKTKRRLLASAVSLWSERGLLGVTISAVAEHAGTTRRTVYHHFATQDVLIAETEQFMETELAALAGGDTRFLSDPYRLVAGLAVDNPDLIRSVLLGLLREPGKHPIYDNAVRYWSESNLDTGLKVGVPPAHAAAITLGMWLAAMMVVSARSGNSERREEADHFALTYERLLAEGILTSGSRQKS